MQQSNSQADVDFYNSDQPMPQPHIKTEQQTNNESEDESEEEQAFGFEVINGQASNQVLLIKLKYAHGLWYKGQVLFSSAPVRNKPNADDWVKGILEGYGMPLSGSIRHLANYNKDMVYYMLSKEYPYNGKILLLNEDVYKQKFFVNYDHLLTINYDTSEYTMSPHPKFRSLKLFSLKTNPTPLFIALQSSKDTAIVEKYLQVNQHMYLPNARILAIGQRVSCRWESKNRSLKFSGPGFIFFEPESKKTSMLPLRNRELILANIFLFLFILILYLVEWLLLN